MPNKRVLALLAAVLLSVPGCALTNLLTKVPAAPVKSVCIAHYESVVPGIDVGHDGCGNRWVRKDGRCGYFIREQGIVTEIICPAEGDTIYVGE